MGYTQAKLVEVLQLSRMTISRYESGTWEVPLSVEMALDQLGSAQIPMLGMVAAGAPIEPITQAELVAVLPPLLRGGETFALRVKGESMKDDSISPGDVMVVSVAAFPIPPIESVRARSPSGGGLNSPGAHDRGF